MPNEATSLKVASKAARIISLSDQGIIALATQEPETIRSVAASCLTQREPRLITAIKGLFSKGG